ncbi:MAG: hypothetical protein K0Q48_1408 [Bacillota bacterium]|jgi:hypothetical protein|nr:hypothetical protein [Bacillota bacterium]
MRVKRFLSLLLCLCMIIALLPTISIPASAKGSSGIRLGTGGIIDGNYIYFGGYNSNPIQWCVLDSEAGNATGTTDTLSDGSITIPNSDAMFLQSKYCFSPQHLSFGDRESGYKDSRARKWVNTTFAADSGNFSLNEQRVMVATTKSDSVFTTACYNRSFPAVTNILQGDRMFLLSAEEAITYYGTEGTNLVAKVNDSSEGDLWWVRSKISQQGIVCKDGKVDTTDPLMFSNLRPAFNLNKNAVLFASAATETAQGGKASGSEGADALTKVSTTKPSEWTLTLLDSNRNFGVSPTAVSANSVGFDYYGAKAGANEYISAVIVDDLGYILHYGRIRKLTNSSGSATINIPSGVTLGDNATLKVFNEQYNGDYKTDYASALQPIVGHKVTYSLVNLEKADGSPIYAVDGEDCTFSLKANEGYLLPESVSVTVGGTPVMPVSSADKADSAGEYYYSSDFGEIKVANVNGPVVITAKGVSAICTLPKSLDFGSITEGYATAPDGQTITIKNNGMEAITGYSITGGGTDYNVTYTSSPISAGGTSTFTAKPADGLSVGAHAKTLTIEIPGGSTATVGITFTVQAKPSSGRGRYSPTYYTISASSSTGGSISPSGSNSVEYGSNATYAITADKGFKIEDVLVDGISVGTVSTYTFKNVSLAHTISASFMKTENPFKDINKDDWFYGNIMYAYENGLMTGTSSDAFSPNGTMTRGMIVTVLHRLSGDKGSYTNAFADIPSGAWYENAAAWASAKGIVGGVGSNQFAPENALSREQLAVMLYNYAKYKGLDVSVGKDTNILSYNDSTDISEYAHSALQWACGSGIIKGDDSGNLNPQSPASRAEVAAILERFIKNSYRTDQKRS